MDVHRATEGIEDTEQLDTLRELGCEAVQGLLLGKPQPTEAIEALLRGDEQSSPESTG